MTKCVFAGTFDPFTIGHLYVVEECLKNYDKVIVALGINTEKTPFFTREERLNILKETFKNNNRVEVVFFEGLLVDFMKKNEVFTTVRGIRDNKDLEYEKIMSRNNRNFWEKVNTEFVMVTGDIAKVSSTKVRDLVKQNLDATEFIPFEARECFNNIIKTKTR